MAHAIHAGCTKEDKSLADILFLLECILEAERMRHSHALPPG